MSRKINIIIILLTLWGLNNQPLFAQEQPLKDLVEKRRDQKFAFYPSTLRMVNLKQNEDYNELVSGVEKLLVYQLDSAIRADKSYRAITSTYAEHGFDEYASIIGGQMQLSVMGKEGRNQNEFVGYLGEKDMVIAFYLRGKLEWQKIPTLLRTLDQEDMLNFFDLN